MATITITPGNSFTATEAVTSTKLNDLGSPTAALTAASIGTADIADDAVTSALIADANVTKAKIENISAPLRVLGRTTAGAGVAEEVTINDDDDMANASAITLATDESIKAYVDAADTEYALKYSGSTGTFSTAAGTFVDLDLSAVVGSNRALVVLEVYDGSVSNSIFYRTKGSTLVPFVGGTYSGWGAAAGTLGTSDNGGTVVVMTDENGIMQHRADSISTGVKYTIQAFQKLFIPTP